MTLSVSIMHVPSSAERRGHVLGARRELARGGITASVVKDPTRQGVWPTSHRAWKEGLTSGATHHLVLQDDVGLCRNFAEEAVAALAAVPDQPVCFYANRKVIDEAHEQGLHWAVIPDGIWGQAPCLPVPLIERFLRWQEEYIAADFKWDDTRLTLFCLVHAMPVWCTVPSLVQHMEPGRSLLGNSNSRRVARVYAEPAGLRINWADTRAVRGAGGLSSYATKYGLWFKKPLEPLP